jgi:hypothetical protein
MTVVTCNGEASPGEGGSRSVHSRDPAKKQGGARLGAFEMELHWTDSEGKARCTVLHSKLASRNFPKVQHVLDE